MNKNLYGRNEFAYIDKQVYCLKDFLSNNKNKFKGCDLSNEQKDLLMKSETIILSTRWLEKDLINLKEIIDHIKKLNKEIIIISNRPEYKTIYQYTLIDKFLLENKKIPSNEERNQLEKSYFKIYKNNKTISKINKDLQKIAIKNSVKIIDIEKLFCSEFDRKCKILDDNNKKIYLDFGHLTLNGSKFLGKMIFNKSLLK